VISRRTVLCLGVAQLVCWGVTYHLIGVFGELIAADLGWSRPLAYGGLTTALVVTGVSSPLAGRMIDRHGGRPAMAAGSILGALGCAGIAVARHVPVYYAAWVCLGLAMRLTLYEAAFAALARIGGPHARRPISQITLLGGLASTVFWPIGHALAERLGWRGAVLVYAALALLTLPLHLTIPSGRYGDAPGAPPDPGHLPLARTERERLVAGSLYALIATLAGFLNSGISPHLIAMLTGFGLAGSLAVWISSLRGVGQSSARICEILFGRRVHPLTLNLIGVLVLPVCFAAGLLSGRVVAAAVVLAFFSGAGNGIVAITRGTLPLVLFDPRTYGAVTGRLLVPSLILSAAAPVTYAFVIERSGESGALYLSVALASAALAAAIVLRAMFPVAAVPEGPAARR
jgi:MFS family permease